jgi:type IV secretory pathway VirJ component
MAGIVRSSRLRRDGERRARVVAATGLGKTYLAAFDAADAERVLFIAHREELLRQAEQAFATLYPERSRGFVVEEVASAVDGWRDEARKAGFSGADIALKEAAFSAHAEYRRVSRARHHLQPPRRAATLWPHALMARRRGPHAMLDRIKDLGGQLSSSAAKVAVTVKDGAGTVVAQAGEAVSATKRKAFELGDRAGTAATREAVAQMRDMLALAVEELRARPIVDGPVTLTAKVDLMLTALQVEFVLHPDTKLLHVPRAAAAAAAADGEAPAGGSTAVVPSPEP